MIPSLKAALGPKVEGLRGTGGAPQRRDKSSREDQKTNPTSEVSQPEATIHRKRRDFFFKELETLVTNVKRTEPSGGGAERIFRESRRACRIGSCTQWWPHLPGDSEDASLKRTAQTQRPAEGAAAGTFL